MLPIETEGKPFTKYCPECKEEKLLVSFRIRLDGRSEKPYTYCRACEVKIGTAVRDLRKNMDRSQPESCECCFKPSKALKLDHCHETNKVRGWICNNCNTGLARFGDNLDGIKYALDYLMRFENEQ